MSCQNGIYEGILAGIAHLVTGQKQPGYKIDSLDIFRQCTHYYYSFGFETTLVNTPPSLIPIDNSNSFVPPSFHGSPCSNKKQKFVFIIMSKKIDDSGLQPSGTGLSIVNLRSRSGEGQVRCR